MFYSPFDIVYKLSKVLPIKIILWKIYEGVNHAHHLYPNAYVIIVIVGAVKGAGSGFMNVIDRFIRGIWLPNSNEILYPSL